MSVPLNATTVSVLFGMDCAVDLVATHPGGEWRKFVLSRTFVFICAAVNTFPVVNVGGDVQDT